MGQVVGIASTTCPTRFDNSSSGAPIITGRKLRWRSRAELVRRDSNCLKVATNDQ
jgi:hypothetical protein